jgi:putative phage-type endonuclease
MNAQGSEEWFAERCGLATASRFRDILAKTKTGESASRRNYRAQLVAERLTGRPAESYSNAAMEWGTATEPQARMAYEAATGLLAVEVGFRRHATLMAGASPDGEIDSDGLIEIKCPNTATHIDTFLNGMPTDHAPQVQGQLWITGRQWCDFVSFDPRLPERMQLHVQRVPRDDAYIKTLEAEIIRFLGEVDSLVGQLEKKAA